MQLKSEIIAEIGQNHNGDMRLACDMIGSAKKNGADAVKFQLYNARELFPVENNPWFDYNRRTELSREQVIMLSGECKKAGIEFFASVFDTERVAWLEDIGVRRYKVASRSIYNKDLLDCLCRTGKPLLVSLGMWKGEGFPRIDNEAGVDFLYCIPKYPAPFSEVKLGSVDFMKYAGLSDHTKGLSCAIAALSRGAKIIEKHFTLNRDMFGPDHACSMDPDELRTLNYFRDDLEELF